MADIFDDKDVMGDEGIANPYEDTKAISARIDRTLTIDKFQRSLFERGWFRNVLMLAGMQWIVLDNGRWRPRKVPAWFPKAITNKTMEKFRDLKAQLIQGKPVPMTYLPATDDPGDVATAEVGQRLREVFYAEAEIEEKEDEVATWLLATGNCFGIPYYDMSDDHGFAASQLDMCDQCGESVRPEDVEQPDSADGEINPATLQTDVPVGVCPECGEMTTFSPAIDAQQQPINGDYPIGAMALDVASPFEIRIDHRVLNVRQQRRFIRQRRYDLDFAKENPAWKNFRNNITADSASESGGNLSQFYLDVLAHVTENFGSSTGMMSGGGQASPKNPKLTAYEMYELPSEKFPDGLCAVRLGTNPNCIVEAGPLKTQWGAGSRKGQKFLPLIHWGCDRVPGRFWRKKPLDDVIPLQIYRNTIEANIRITCTRMGNAIWLDPKGSGVDILTGEPGQRVRYNPVSVGGQSFAKPERVPAELNAIQPLIMTINKIDDEIERVAGTFFLQGGDTPPGVTAASALAYLGERAQKAMSPLMTNWGKGWKQFDLMALELARENWDDTRFRAVAGKNRAWDVMKFTKADLKGAVNVIVDYNGLFPKSNATRRATIAQLTQLGIVNPQDFEMQWKILLAFGETELKGSVDLDVKDAVREQDRFMSEGITPVVHPWADNDTVHIMYHTDLTKTDEFQELPPEQQEIWYQHIQAQVQDMVQRRMAFAQVGLDPDAPGLAEITSAEAIVAAQAEAGAMQQAGGAPSGAEGPDSRLDATGAPKPAGPIPDIAAGGDSGMGPGLAAKAERAGANLSSGSQ